MRLPIHSTGLSHPTLQAFIEHILSATQWRARVTSRLLSRSQHSERWTTGKQEKSQAKLMVNAQAIRRESCGVQERRFSACDSGWNPSDVCTHPHTQSRGNCKYGVGLRKQTQLVGFMGQRGGQPGYNKLSRTHLFE